MVVIIDKQPYFPKAVYLIFKKYTHFSTEWYIEFPVSVNIVWYKWILS